MELRSKILVFKTNLETEDGIQAISGVLNDDPGIARWTVDQSDVDNVLRIEAHEPSLPSVFIAMIQKAGFDCDELPD